MSEAHLPLLPIEAQVFHLQRNEPSEFTRRRGMELLGKALAENGSTPLDCEYEPIVHPSDRRSDLRVYVAAETADGAEPVIKELGYKIIHSHPASIQIKEVPDFGSVA